MRAPVVVLVAMAIAASGACARRSGSTQWPTRPVTVIVPFGPGTGSDLVARLLAPRLSERWRQPVVVDNRPGADGIVGVQVFASAKDEHTLVFTPAGPITLSPLLHERLPFDPVRDLVPTAAVVTASIGIAATSTVKQLVARRCGGAGAPRAGAAVVGRHAGPAGSHLQGVPCDRKAGDETRAVPRHCRWPCRISAAGRIHVWRFCGSRPCDALCSPDRCGCWP